MTIEEAIECLNFQNEKFFGGQSEALKMAISALSENNKEWIPCSERLPEEEDRRYWICTDCGYQCECRWTNVNPIWTDLTTDWHWHIIDDPNDPVVAWMPLPESYKAERISKEEEE